MRIGLVLDPFDPSKWEELEGDDARALLAERLDYWPESARIYDLQGFGDWRRAAALTDPSILAARDVTPRDEAGVERLGQLEGPLLVVISPADPVTAIIAVAAVLVGVLAAFLFLPKVPTADNTLGSSNNSLGSRSNQARPNSRIPDIFGTVRSIADLLAVPYRQFVENIETEVAFMCVGRGSYAITDVRDGDTLIGSIAGSSAAFYNPGQNPSNGGVPFMQIGSAIEQPVLSVVQMNEVNGQLLRPPNGNYVQGDGSIRFVYPDEIQQQGGTDFTTVFGAGDSLIVGGAQISGSNPGNTQVSENARFVYGGVIQFDSFDPTTTFATGQTLTVTNGSFSGPDESGGNLYVDLSGVYTIASLDSSSITLDDPAGVNSDWNNLNQYAGNHTDYHASYFSVPKAGDDIDLDGTYTIVSVSSGQIVLSNPAATNADWNNLEGLNNNGVAGATDWTDASLSTTADKWIGPFIVDIDNQDRLLINLLAQAGIYRLTAKGKQHAETVNFVIEATPVDANDAPTGPAQNFDVQMVGADDNKDQVGSSTICQLTNPGRQSVRIKRTSAIDLNYNGTFVTDVKWYQGYGMAPIGSLDFGDVTTVHTRTYATASATSVKERKFNCLATRKLPQRISGSEFTTTLFATDSADDIIAAMCLDSQIGNRQAGEVDFDNIYDTVASIATYFGSPLAKQFGYTFDDSSMSFEESLGAITQAIFCLGYRQGSVVRISFEKATNDSTLLFNHRNVLPNTTQRTVRFGALDDHDGVEVEYTDTDDGSVLTLKLPFGYTALNPQQLKLPGLNHYEQAYWQGWRALHKLQRQNIAVSFEATQEAGLVLPSDRILAADLTRYEPLTGDIQSQAGTTLTLSQPAALDPTKSWTIFIQHVDGTVEALGVQSSTGANADPYDVVLSALPRSPLSVDPSASAKATYMIVGGDEVRSRAYLVTERSRQSDFTESVQAVNYSPLYYANDQLALWLNFTTTTLEDDSPFLETLDQAGSGSIQEDVNRDKLVWAGSADTTIAVPDLLAPASYTKTAWLNTSTGGSIIGTDVETFAVAGNTITAGHATAINAPWISGTWHHAAVTYDADSQDMVLYVDGLPVANGTIAQRALHAMSALNGLVDRADDVRLYTRALAPEEIRALYISTPSVPGHIAVAIERGGAATNDILGTEGGDTISLE